MLKVCLVAIAALVVIVGGVACQTPLRAKMREVDYGDSTRSAVAQDAIDDSEDFINQLQGGGSAEAGDPISITLTEAQVTAIAAEQIEGGSGTPISNILVNINPEEVLMAANVVYTASGIDEKEYEIVTEIIIQIVDGRLSIGIGDFSVNRLPASWVPGMREWFASQLSSALGSALGAEVDLSAIDISEGINDITLGDGELTISGTVTAGVY